MVLLSGGVDSTTTLAIARRDGFATHALTFRYGQRHAVEVDAAAKVARALGAASHTILDLPVGRLGGSALTADIPVPKDRAEDGAIPVTYVPARNTIFLAFALGLAEVNGAADIFIGANAVDYSGYPDCRPEFLVAFEAMANRATKAAVEGRQRITIHAPLLRLSKADIIRTGLSLGVDYGMTISCYDPGPAGEPCGHCDSCRIRDRAFAEVQDAQARSRTAAQERRE